MEERQSSFFIDYLMNIWTPSRAIRKRDAFSLGKLVLIMLFLLALLLTPFALNANKQEVVMHDYLPHVEQLLNKEAVQQVHRLALHNGQKNNVTFTVKTKEGMVKSVNGQVKEMKVSGNAVVFGKNQCLLSDENGKQMLLTYPNKTMTFSNNKDDIYTFMSQLWLQQNQLSLKLLFLWAAFTIMASLFALVILGGMVGLAFVLKRRHYPHIVKTSLTLVLLAAGVPTLASSFIGIICHDPMLAMQLQMATWVLMIALIFCKLLVPTLNIGKELKTTFWKGNAK